MAIKGDELSKSALLLLGIKFKNSFIHVSLESGPITFLDPLLEALFYS